MKAELCTIDTSLNFTCPGAYHQRYQHRRCHEMENRDLFHQPTEDKVNHGDCDMLKTSLLPCRMLPFISRQSFRLHAIRYDTTIEEFNL